MFPKKQERLTFHTLPLYRLVGGEATKTIVA
jgi:hypothetical protein